MASPFLPDDVWGLVFSFLAEDNMRDLCAVSRVCRAFRRLARSDALWEPAFRERFPHTTRLMSHNVAEQGGHVPRAWKARFAACAGTGLRWTRLPTLRYSLGTPSFSAFALTSEGRDVVAGFSNGVISVWSDLELVESQLRPRTSTRLLGHGSAISSVKLVHPQGQGRRLVYSVSWDTWLRVWDADTAECLSTLPFCHTAGINCLDINEEHAVTCGDDALVKLYDRTNNGAVSTLARHVAPVYCCLLGQDCCRSQVLTGAFDNTCVAWDIRSGAVSAKFKGHRFRVYDVLQVGYRVVSASGDGCVRFFDVRNPSDALAHCQLSNWVESLALVSGLVVSAGSGGGMVDFMSLEQGTWLGSFPDPFPTNAWKIRALDCSNIPGLALDARCGSAMVLALHDGSVRVVMSPLADVEGCERVQCSPLPKRLVWQQGESGVAHHRLS